MSVRSDIEGKLRAAFEIAALEVIDESHLHAGHAGARPEGETHFRVVLSSPDFEPLSRVERQRRVNEVLKDELAGPVHALALKLSVAD